MESLLTFTCEHANSAHWVLFLLIMLAGLNVPLSEDILLITGGAIASSCIPEHTTRMFIWLFMAAWLSAWEAYWIGRLLGPKLYDIKWFSHILTIKRIERLHRFYERFGILTFFVGRFIPGGVRNALFMTSGLGKMPFHKFILRDFPACLLSASVIFYIGYLFGENFQVVIDYFKTYNTIALILIILAITIAILLTRKRKKTKKVDEI